jgi:hypothetical protein
MSLMRRSFMVAGLVLTMATPIFGESAPLISHDPDGPVAHDRQGVSGAAVPLAGGIKPVMSGRIAYPLGKFATEPFDLASPTDEHGPR